MIGGQNQYLAFNPKKPARADRHQRQGYQLRTKLTPNAYGSEAVSRNYQNGSQRSDGFQNSNRPYPERQERELMKSAFSQGTFESQESNDQKKQDIMNRVKKLQNLVLPLVEKDGEEDEEKTDMGWQSKIERKLIKMEGQLDNVKKEWSINLQKKIMKFEEQLEERYLELKERNEL